MAPNKLEEHIKKELQEREIQPSTNAWGRIAERLDDEAPKAKKRGYLWYGIAASVIGLLTVSVFFIDSGSDVNTTNIQIVDTKNEATESPIDSKIVEENVEEELVVENDKIEQIPSKTDISITKNSRLDIENQVASTEEIDSEIDFSTEKAAISDSFEEEIINTKILEIVAAVDSLEQINMVLTDAEVDSLLRNAQKEIFRDKLFNQNGSVDAMALLTEAEEELDQSFRDQIFDSLKTGFLKVKTAVADRNK